MGEFFFQLGVTSLVNLVTSYVSDAIVMFDLLWASRVFCCQISNVIDELAWAGHQIVKVEHDNASFNMRPVARFCPLPSNLASSAFLPSAQ